MQKWAMRSPRSNAGLATTGRNPQRVRGARVAPVRACSESAGQPMDTGRDKNLLNPDHATCRTSERPAHGENRLWGWGAVISSQEPPGSSELTGSRHDERCELHVASPHGHPHRHRCRHRRRAALAVSEAAPEACGSARRKFHEAQSSPHTSVAEQQSTRTNQSRPGRPERRSHGVSRR